MDDLISRKSLLEKTHMADVLHAIKGITKSVEVVLADDVEVAPSAFEGMTVGEVMKAVFKIEEVQIVKRQYTVHIYPLGKNQTASISISREFWDSPYKGVSE